MRNLVIGCVGDESLHRSWIDERERKEFALLLVYYGDEKDRWREDADRYLVKKGSKWHLVSHAADRFDQLLSCYDNIWIPDDDILADTATINRMFRLFVDHRLELAQPSLDRASFMSHEITRQRRMLTLRFTNFVEVMVPIMTRRAFELLRPSFTENQSGWGLDYYWASQIESRLDRDCIGILDAVSVRHTRQIDLEHGRFYATLKKSPQDDLTELLTRYHLEEKQVEYKRRLGFLGIELTIPSWGYFRRRAAAS